MGRRRGRYRCPRCSKGFDNARAVGKHVTQPLVACRRVKDFGSKINTLLVQQEDEESSNVSEIAAVDIDGFGNNDNDILIPPADNFHGAPDAIYEANVLPEQDDGLYFKEYHPAGDHTVPGQGKSFVNMFQEDVFASEREENPFYPFASWGDWEFGEFCLQSGMSMETINKLLGLEFIQRLPISFKSAKDLRNRAEILPTVPQWQSKPWPTEVATRQPVKIFFRDPLQCLQYILCNPALNGRVDMCPYRLYTSAAKLMRVYTEWMSGDASWEMRGKLPAGATLLGTVLSSDKTNISNQTGHRMAHPLLISVANIHKKYRTKGNSQCFALLALLPIAKFIHKNRRMRSLLQDRLTHEALDFILQPLKRAACVGVLMSDPAGCQRVFYPLLASYIVDTPEAQLLAGVGGRSSPVTMAHYTHFGDPYQHEPRSGAITLAKIDAAGALADPDDIVPYFRVASNIHLNGVHKVFWRDWYLAEPAIFLTPEILHHLHRQFWDHDARWCIRAVGDGELDFRFALLQMPVGYRSFLEGISKLKQVTGRIQREIQRYIVSLITGAVPKNFVIAIRSLLDFRYILQAPTLTGDDCSQALKALEEFHNHKQSILDAGARVGKGNKPINDWRIPKVELMQSMVPNVTYNGAPHQWSADVTERKHITEVKIPARAGNNQNYETQMCRFLDRRDKCRRFGAALKLTGIVRSDELNAENEEDDLPDELDEEDLAELEGVSRTIIDYFDIAKRLLSGDMPKAPRPYRTMATQSTAIHLTRDPSGKAISIDEIAVQYSLPDLRPALSDYIQCSSSSAGSEQVLRGRRVSHKDCSLPFEKAQIWTKVWLQTKSYHDRSQLLPAQALHTMPPSNKWPRGRYDTALVNVDPAREWPDSGIRGHTAVQIRLIIRPAGYDSFLAYVQRFDYVRSTPTNTSTSSFVDPVSGLIHLKRGMRTDNTRFGDIIPLTSLCTATHIVPKFAEAADPRLTTQTALEFSTEFWLNTYFTKEFFYATRFKES